MYLGKLPLSAVGLTEFNELVFRSNKIAQLIYAHTVDTAELFVLLHECSHKIPAPGFQPSINLPEEFVRLSSFRRQGWLTELQADASATYLLLLATAEMYSRRFGVPMEKARVAGAGIAFAGIDAAIHPLLVLEKRRFGEKSIEDWAVDPAWATHPPGVLRRNTFGFVSRALAQQIVGTADWEEIRISVAGMATARQQLFDKYLQAHGGQP
jgi:hypothetical protein